MDLLPYYFKEQDTYKVNGRGLLERYLDIFGVYFDEQVIGNINTLDDIINVDTTPELYLGYLWEFLGSLPYANPKAIDPDKWREYFNGFNSDSTIETMSKLWLYRKDSDGDRYTLTLSQVRALVKYSVALFSIRGTKKFFEVLLKLYGFDVTISNGDTYPDIIVEDDDDHDYYGTDQDYYGTDDDYAGSIDSLFNIKTEPTKLDSEWLNLDEDTIDNHSDCVRLVNLNFKLKSNIVYTVGSNEFIRLQDRMFNLINMFLPVGTRPHIIWDNVSTGNNYESKVSRSIEVYIDRLPINFSSQDTSIVPSVEYPGWYRVYDEGNAYDFSWSSLRFMVKVKDGNSNHIPAFAKDQLKKYIVAFNGEDYSDVEYDDGHIFTLKPGGDIIYWPKFKVSVLCDDDFDLTNGILSTFTISSWKKEFNYTIFKHYNSSVDCKLSNTNNYIPVLIQSAFVKTYTNNADPEDDEFIPQPVINVTTGELLTLCEDGTKLPDREGNDVDYSQYKDRYIYVQHLFEPGLYEFAMVDMPEYRFTVEVTREKEVLTISLVYGVNPSVIDNDTPETVVGLKVISNLNFLKHVFTLPFYINDNNGNIWSSIVNGADEGNKPSVYVGNIFNKPYFRFSSISIYHLNTLQRSNAINFNLAYLTNPVNQKSQFINFIVKEFSQAEDHPDDFSIKKLTFYPVTGDIYVEEEIHETGVDGVEISFKYGDEVHVSINDPSPFSSLFTINNPILKSGLSLNGTVYHSDVPISTRNIFLEDGLTKIAPNPSEVRNEFIIEYCGLYDDEVLIKETTNPITRYWNNGELIVLDSPGHYKLYGTNHKFDNVESNYLDINVTSNKYNVKYYLEVEDGDKSDDEAYMVRTLIPVPDDAHPVIPGEGGSEDTPATKCTWEIYFTITLDKSVIEAQDIETLDPNAFDFEVLLYRGSNPSRGSLIGSFTATVEEIIDDLNNVLPHYKKKGTISLSWDYGDYDLSSTNFPPGLYCIELHDKNHIWPDTPTYRLVDAYVIPKKFDGNLYFDVDVISKAWTSPAGQAYDIDPITGKYTWGWFKTNEEYLHSVRLVRYDPAIDIPRFRLKLTNNTIGYTRVYMYKLVDNGSEWDIDATYPKVLSPKIKSPNSNTGINNPHWLDEALPKDWGFPGDFDDVNGVWDYSKGSTGVNNYKDRWLFTGSVYQLGDIITGPQEPGKYLFLVNQLSIDNKVINYAYLEVKEEINYSLIVSPLLGILQGTAVGTTVDAISSAKFTKETLCVTVTPPNSIEGSVKYNLPYAFYAYQPGIYTFRLYRHEGGDLWTDLNIEANFKVLTDSGISDENLSWLWSDESSKLVEVVTTSNEVDWTVKIQDE